MDKRLLDKTWRMSHLYKIVDRNGQRVTFKRNRAQEHFESNRHTFNLILKSRRLGFTTFEAVDTLDDVLFNRNFYSLFIAHTQNDAKRIFDDKVKFSWNNIPELIRNLYKIDSDKSDALRVLFGDGTFSSLTVAGSGRSGTYGRVHASEFGKLCKTFPDRADEIVTGTIPAVPIGSRFDIESTAEGEVGYFHDMFWNAWNRGEPKFPKDFKAHFYNWQWDDEEIAKSATEQNIRTFLTSDDFAEFDDYRKKMAEHGIVISDKELTYYYMQWLTFNRNWPKMKQEFPTTPDEAFIGSGNKMFDMEIVSMLATVDGKKDGSWTIFKEYLPGKIYVMGCLPDGELILTSEGAKKIEDISIDDTLIDENGSETKIVNIQKRFYEGKLYDIQPYLTAQSSRFTSIHPIQVLADNKIHRESKSIGGKRYYNLDTEWKNAEFITEKDILRFPIRYTSELEADDIASHFPQQEDVRIDRRLNASIIHEKDFWFFMGLWLAEGWIRNEGENKIKTITVHLNSKTERELADTVCRIVNDLFRRKATVYDRGNVLDITFSSEVISKFMELNFGHKSYGKFISEWIKYLPYELKKSLFEGYFVGDGSYIKKETRSKIGCTSVSERLLNDFQDILLSMGVISSVNVLREAGTVIFPSKPNRKYKTRKTFSLVVPSREIDKLFETNITYERARHKRYAWIDGNYLYVKVKSVRVTDFRGNVNNFETEAHSYCTPRISTHNCDVAEGVGQDSSTAVILDITNSPYEVVATYVNNRVSPDVFATELARYGTRYGRCIIAPEMNSIGYATVSRLKDMYTNVYKSTEFNKAFETKARFARPNKTLKYGWRTTSSSKPKMLFDLKEAINGGDIIINDARIKTELRTYQQEDLSKIRFDDDQETQHWDLLMALAIAFQMRTNIARKRTSQYVLPVEKF